MRWSYKTVHYNYKKEGLLGGEFLDEAEMEESMNEFGRAGWELVSLLEVQEGLIATFKQPIDIPSSRKNPPTGGDNKAMPSGAPRFLRPERSSQGALSGLETGEETHRREEYRTETHPGISVEDPRAEKMKTVKKQVPEDEENNGGAGAIRIE